MPSLADRRECQFCGRVGDRSKGVRLCCEDGRDFDRYRLRIDTDKVERTGLPGVQTAVADLSDDAIRAFWREQGGQFHGPNVEHGTMPEQLLLPLLRRLVVGCVR